VCVASVAGAETRSVTQGDKTIFMTEEALTTMPPPATVRDVLNATPNGAEVAGYWQSPQGCWHVILAFKTEGYMTDLRLADGTHVCD
jgi:hypothetical protein